MNKQIEIGRILGLVFSIGNQYWDRDWSLGMGIWDGDRGLELWVEDLGLRLGIGMGIWNRYQDWDLVFGTTIWDRNCWRLVIGICA